MKITILARCAALFMMAGSLGACESVNSAAENSKDKLSDWYESAKKAVSGSDYDPNRSYIANQLGDAITDADALAIERESVKALETTPDGQTLRWDNPQSGASAAITPIDTSIEPRQQRTPRSKEVADARSFTLIGQTYRAVKNSNVRAAPGTHNPIVGKLPKGTTVTALGKVDGTEWIMIARDGTAVGYVYEPLIKPVENGDSSYPPLRKILEEEDQHAGDGLVVAELKFYTSCRSVDYDVTLANGETARDSFRACKAHDGAWEID